MSKTGTRSEVVLALAEEFVERYRQGERPSLREYVDGHPELAEEIREVFPAMALMENIALVHESAEANPQTPVAVPLQQLGDYRIIRPIGHGGMGIVYEAEQVSLGRHVALKVLPRKMLVDAKHRRRFEREARLAAKLHHTNIVPVFGVGEQDGLPYYVMQFIPGLGLDQVLEELKRLRAGGGQPKNTPADAGSAARKDLLAADVARSLLTGQFEPAAADSGLDPLATEAPADPPAGAAEEVSSAAVLPEGAVKSRSSSSVALPGQSGTAGQRKAKPPTYWQSVAQIGAQVASALEYAHQQGVLHRDIKPSNLLLDRRTTVWVTDFGLAKGGDSEDLTHTGDVLGTLRYMPPEAFEGKSDARSDVYSLGLTLYELLALRPAFEEKERHKLIKQVTTTEPPRLERLNREVPRDLVTVVHKAIDRDPRQRYASAAELAADLQRFTDDEPIKARPLGAAERLWRWCRHNPLLAGSLTTVAATLVLGTVAAWLLTAWALTEKGKAADKAAEANTQREAAVAAKGKADEEAERAKAAEENTRRQWYAANLSLIQKAWDTNHVAHLRSLLAETELYADRGFEWYYWQRLCHLDLHTFIGHRGGVWAVSWSPDGKWLATGSDDGTAKVWDATSGQERLTLQGHASVVACVSWSPDGKRLATGGGVSTGKVWDAAGGQELLTLEGHTRSLWSVSWSPDGKRLATGGNDHTAKVWEAASGRELRTLQGHSDWVYSVFWSPDGQRLATASLDGTAKIWDVAGGRELRTLQGHTGLVRSVFWSPDGQRLATAGADGTAKVWDAADGRQLLTLRGHSSDVRSASWSPEGQRLATGSGDGTAKVWDAADGREMLSLKGHTNAVECVSWSPDGQRLATASRDGRVKVWDAADSRQFSTLKRHKESVLCVSWSSDGRRLATGSGDGTAIVWDAATNQERISFQRHTDGIGSVCWSRDDTRLVTASEDGTVKVWAAGDGRELLLLKGRRVCWSPDGTRLATVHEHATMVWDAVGGRLLFTCQGHGSTVTSVCWSPDSTRLATGSADGTAIVWDGAGGGKQLTLEGHTSGVRSVSWSPDGARLATGSDDGTVKVWNTADGRELLTRQGTTGEVSSLSWSPDGKRLATGSEDGPAKVSDPASGQELLTLPGSTVSWSPDGKRVATGSGDGTVKVWEAASALKVQEWAREDRALEATIARNALRGPHAQGFIKGVTASPQRCKIRCNEELYQVSA